MHESGRVLYFKKLGVRFANLPTGTCLIKLKGDLDQTSFGELSVLADRYLKDHQAAVILDMAELAFMDSSGVKFINRLINEFGFGNVAVYRIHEDLDRVLAILGLQDKIVHLSRADSLRHWRGEARHAA